jgi:hypothetical protein
MLGVARHRIHSATTDVVRFLAEWSVSGSIGNSAPGDIVTNHPLITTDPLLGGLYEVKFNGTHNVGNLALTRQAFFINFSTGFDVNQAYMFDRLDSGTDKLQFGQQGWSGTPGTFDALQGHYDQPPRGIDGVPTFGGGSVTPNPVGYEVEGQRGRLYTNLIFRFTLTETTTLRIVVGNSNTYPTIIQSGNYNLSMTLYQV